MQLASFAYDAKWEERLGDYLRTVPVLPLAAPGTVAALVRGFAATHVAPWVVRDYGESMSASRGRCAVVLDVNPIATSRRSPGWSIAAAAGG